MIVSHHFTWCCGSYLRNLHVTCLEQCQHVASTDVSYRILLTSVLICFPVLFLLKCNIVKTRRGAGRKRRAKSPSCPTPSCSVWEKQPSLPPPRGLLVQSQVGGRRTGAWLCGHEHRQKDANLGAQALNQGIGDRLAWQKNMVLAKC